MFVGDLRWAFARPRQWRGRRLEGEGGGMRGGGFPGAWGELSYDCCVGGGESADLRGWRMFVVGGCLLEVGFWMTN